jgi:hypothetical protein
VIGRPYKTTSPMKFFIGSARKATSLYVHDLVEDPQFQQNAQDVQGVRNL